MKTIDKCPANGTVYLPTKNDFIMIEINKLKNRELIKNKIKFIGSTPMLSAVSINTSPNPIFLKNQFSDFDFL